MMKPTELTVSVIRSSAIAPVSVRKKSNKHPATKTTKKKPKKNNNMKTTKAQHNSPSS